jgi:hypothetical protein
MRSKAEQDDKCIGSQRPLEAALCQPDRIP